jgi:hypothetical protein
MDQLDHYRNLIKQSLTAYADLVNRQRKSNLETQLIFDTERDHYMLFRSGWWDKERVRTPTLYVRLHNGKIWIEEDWTEDGLATELLAAGVPKEDIVLAFHHPSVRPLTEFAIA